MDVHIDQPIDVSSSSNTFTLGGLKDSTEYARRSLNHCLISHMDCTVHIPGRSLPTRLIKLEPDALRLYTTKAQDEFSSASLSHCWGRTQFLNLLSSNLEELHCFIPQKQLSKTFLDAVKIAETLGYEYLWIDSLCIIQDNKADWEWEASRMTDVYGFSDLDIAATASSDGSV